MDADDRIAPNELIRLKHAVASGQAEAYVCRVMSQSGQKGVIEAVEHIRLFRNGLGLCFERPLHEDIAPAARRLGVTIARAGVTIQHVGYAAGPQALQAKARRNREMIEQCLAREPGSLYWRFQLGVNLYTLEDFAGAAEHLAAVVAAPPASLVENREIYKAHALLVAAYVALPRPDEAQQALRHALKLFPGSRHVHILAGKFYLAQDEPERAVEALERARGLSSEADVTGMEWPGGALEAYLSQAYLQLAKRWSSQRDFVRMAGTCALAVEVSPQNGEAYKHLAVALQAIGRQEDALLCWQTARRLEDVSRS
jgi:tetratricopeptide (TPR) repeat protein